jgi:hypothetical protein
MTCHTRRAETAARPDSTQHYQANAVRPSPDLPLLSDLFERRHVGVMLRSPADREGRLYPAEVLCDLPGGRALVQILGSTICFWAAQSSVARLVTAEIGRAEMSPLRATGAEA